MKKQFLFAVAVTMLTACVNTDTLNEIQSADPGIEFNTFVSKQTKAENSSATVATDLKSFNHTFSVWGNKYVKTTWTPVFGVTRDGSGNVTGYPGEKVEYSTTSNSLIGNWIYNPIRFWDKSATKYDFHAASPFNPISTNPVGDVTCNGWTLVNSDDPTKTMSFTINNFRVSGTNMATDPTNTTIDAAKVMASLDTEDLMIAEDILEHKDYSSTAQVQLHFIHLLSRLNIGIRKDAKLNDFVVKLNSLKIYNMKSQGSFNEAQELIIAGTTLATGTQERWTKVTGNTDKFAPGNMKFEPNEPQEITETTNYQYVYEGLVMPQTIGYSKTVLVNETPLPASYLYIDGSNALSTGETWSNPYIVIDYEIWTKNINYTEESAYAYNQTLVTGSVPTGWVTTEVINPTTTNYYTAAEANAHNGALEGKPSGFKTTADIETSSQKVDGYKYYFNLADVFGGDGTDANRIDFCEGWQNTLNITLSPVAIKFVPDVYKWEEMYGSDNPKTGKTFEIN